jgi:hypothetical protein
MRLSDWTSRAPRKEALAPKVVAVIEPVLTSLGAGPDPSCWISWGDDPAARYLLLTPTAAGLLMVHVRVNVPQEGPRASGKLIRWSRVQTGELAVEMAGGHRLLSFQVEGQVLRGSDAEADDIAAFALDLFAAMDGRADRPSVVAPGRTPRGKAAAASRAAPRPTSRSGMDGRRPPSSGSPGQ